MTLIESMQASANVLVQVVNPAARAVALAGAAAAGLAAFRVKNTSVQLSTWRAVLYAALAMPLLGWLLPPLAIPMPAFLQSAPQRTIPADVPSEVHTPQSFVATSVSASANHADSKVVVTRNAAVKGIPAAGIGEHQASAARVSPAPAMKSASVVANPAAFSPFRWSTIPWGAVAVMSYLAVALFFVARFCIGLLLGRRLLRASHKIDEPRVALRLSSRAHYSGLTAVPSLAESELIAVPVTMGALRTTILLPASWREWDQAKLDAILAHEVSHVARRDGLTQRLSLLHRAIFWFSPLAWWLDRHLADLAEQASDEAALSGGADRNEYARTLLGFFEALHASPGRVWWQGVAMAKAGQAERHAERQAEERLERILSWKGSVAMGAKNMNVTKSSVRKLIAVAVVVLAVPVVYLAAAVGPAGALVEPQHLPFARERSVPPAQSPAAATQSVQSAPATPQPESSSVPAPAPDAEMAPPPEDGPEDAPVPPQPEVAGEIHVIGTVRAVPAVAPMAPLPSLKGLPAYPPVAALAARGVIAPRAPMAPAIWRGQTGTSGSSHGKGFSYHYAFDDDQRFVIVTGKSDSFTMSGSGEDARHVEKLRKTIQGDFIWFERDEKTYIIRDQVTIDRAKKFWEGDEELGKKQEALGAQQEILGKQQEELGKKMEEVQVNVPDMTAELDKLKAKLQKLGSHATMDQIGDLQSEIGDLQSKIGDIQSHAGDAQGKLGEEQGALGEKQGKLGEEQGKLGEQQAELAQKATQQMKELLDESIKKGIAQPEL